MTEESDPGLDRQPDDVSPAESAAPTDDLPSLPVRVSQVFFSPGELFDRLKARPAWLGALVTLTVISIISTMLIPEELIRQVVMDQLGDEAEPAQIEAAMRIAGIMRFVGPVVMPTLLTAFLAGIIMLIWNLILGGEASFKQVLSATAHVMFIPTLGSLLAVPLIIAASDVTVSLGLHLLLPGGDDESFLFRFLRGLNLFSIWAAVVLGLAVSRLHPRSTPRGAATVLLSLYVVKAVAGAAFRFG